MAAGAPLCGAPGGQAGLRAPLPAAMPGFLRPRLQLLGGGKGGSCGSPPVARGHPRRAARGR
eukprot:3832212-Lingulodinium_polyedra.AAC.1